MDGPLDNWEPWRRGASTHGFDPSTRTFSDDITHYGAIPTARYTNGHATSSLARVKAEDIERSTKIVSVDAASHLAGYEDPIKLILPPVLQEANVVYVKRKFAVGNTATEVPERAPAPVVSVQEETRRVTLRRFGGDIDFNVNACSVPDLFRKEMDLKVGAQHAALADRLVALGYETLIREGTDFTSALVRSNHGMDADVRMRARRFYFEQVFGALSTNPYPIHNLLAAAKRCTAYDISKSTKTVMILPHGVPEMMAYTRAENMKYEINGVAGPQGKPITMKVDTGYKIPATTAAVFVHIPPALHLHGSAAPVAGQNALEETVEVFHTYRNADSTPFYRGSNEAYSAAQQLVTDFKSRYFTDMINRQYRSIGDANAGILYSFDAHNCVMRVNPGIVQRVIRNAYFSQTDGPRNSAKNDATAYDNATTRYQDEVLVEPRQNVQKIVSTELNTMHAIIATPGDETGNLLMQYPRSTVSADASTESGRMQLRVYMGAVLKRPENVMVMRNVAFNGIRGQRMLGCEYADDVGVRAVNSFDTARFYNTVETAPCLFPSKLVFNRYAQDPPVGIPEKYQNSYVRFMGQINKTAGDFGVITDMTGLTFSEDDGRAGLLSSFTSNAGAIARPAGASINNYYPTTAELQFDSGNLGKVISDFYPVDMTSRIFNTTGGALAIPAADIKASIDLCSAVLRMIMLNASDVALEDARRLDNELNIDDELSEAYHTAVLELRTYIYEQLEDNCITRECNFTDESLISATIYAAKNADAYNNTWMRLDSGFEKRQWQKDDASVLIQFALKKLHLYNAEHSVSFAGAAYSRAQLINLLSKPATEVAAYLSMVTYDSNRNVAGVDNAPAAPADIDANQDAASGRKPISEQKGLYAKYISAGLAYTDMCAKVLYLFCEITQQRNDQMRKEQYRFQQGATHTSRNGQSPQVTKLSTQPSRNANNIQEMDARYFPLPVSPNNGPFLIASTDTDLKDQNHGQFKSLDDVNAVDKFSGMAIQKYSQPIAPGFGHSA